MFRRDRQRSSLLGILPSLPLAIVGFIDQPCADVIPCTGLSKGLRCHIYEALLVDPHPSPPTPPLPFTARRGVAESQRSRFRARRQHPERIPFVVHFFSRGLAVDQSLRR